MDTTVNKSAYKYQVFISYASEDRNFASKVVTELKQFNYRVWRDEDILSKYPGDEYTCHVEEGIDNSAVVLYIHSKASSGKWYVQEREIPYALKQNKRILVFCLNGMPAEFQHKELFRKQHIALMHNIETGLVDGLLSIRIAVQRYFGDLSAGGIYKVLETSDNILAQESIHGQLTDTCFIWNIPENKREELRKYNFHTQLSDEGGMHSVLRNFLSDHFSDEYIDSLLAEVTNDTADYFLERKKAGKTIFNGPMIGVSKIISDRSSDGKEVHSLTLEMYRSDYFTFKCMSALYGKFNQEIFQINSLADIPRYAPFFCSLGMGGFVLEEEKETALWIRRSTSCEAGDQYHFSYDETVAVKDIDESSQGKKVDVYGTLYRGIKEELGLYPNDFTSQGGIFEIGLILTKTRIELEMLSYLILTPSTYADFDKILASAEDGKLEVGAYSFWDFQEYKRELTNSILTPESLELIQRLEIRRAHGLLFTSTASNTAVKQQEMGENILIDSSAIVSPNCKIGDNCKIHHFVQIDDDVVMGNNVKIQNNVMVPHGVTLEDGVFVGPSVVFTNDKYPRSITPEGKLKTGAEWEMTPTLVKEGASLGGGAVIVCGVTIGRWAMVGAGALVTKDVPDYALVVGCPAKIVGKVDETGKRIG